MSKSVHERQIPALSACEGNTPHGLVRAAVLQGSEAHGLVIKKAALKSFGNQILETDINQGKTVILTLEKS